MERIGLLSTVANSELHGSCVNTQLSAKLLAGLVMCDLVTELAMC